MSREVSVCRVDNRAIEEASMDIPEKGFRVRFDAAGKIRNLDVGHVLAGEYMGSTYDPKDMRGKKHAVVEFYPRRGELPVRLIAPAVQLIPILEAVLHKLKEVRDAHSIGDQSATLQDLRS